MPYALVPDSTADIPHGLARHWNIEVVPAFLIIQGQSFRDRVDITRQAFYQRLPQYDPPPTTAAPSSGVFEQVYARLLEVGYEGVVSVHCAVSLSGLYNAARLGAEPFGGRVTVVDSGQLSMGLGFQVLAAA